MSSSCIQNLKILSEIEAEKSVNFVREKEKWTNKGTDKPVQLVIPDVCTKFQNPKSSSF